MARVAEQGPQARPSASHRWRVTAVLLLGLGGGLALRREVRDELALIPGGTFEMGSSPDELRATWEWCQRVPGDLEDCNREVFEREQPLRRVSLPPFYMERTEVTNQRFVNWLNRRAGVRLQDGWLLDGDGESRLINLYPSYGPRFALRYSGGRIEAVAGEEQMPVVQVTWVGADRFCRSQGRRLPTEAEWEFTARSTQGHPFPWGAAEPRCDSVVFARLPGQRCAEHGALAGAQGVGTALQDRTALGVYDLGGNVAEWVQDRFLERYAPCALSAGCLAPLAEGSEGRSTTALSRVFRGGNWAETEVALRGTGRGRWLEDQGLRNVGFRCVSNRPASTINR